MNIFAITQIIISVLLVAAILIQERGTGLGSTFGGESSLYRSKRGVEKILFLATIVLSILFALNAILAVVNG